MGRASRGASARAAVKPSLAPVRNEMLNASGSRRIMLENLVMATARSRRWYATTVKNVLDRAGDQQVREAAQWFTGGKNTGRSVMYVFGK